MRRRDISKAVFATAAATAVVAQRAEAQTCTALCYAQTTAESAAGVTPSNYAYAPLNPFRYGADGSGGSNDAAALAAIQSVLTQVAGIHEWQNGMARAGFEQTAAEMAAGVTPVNFAFQPGHILRYGNNTLPGTTCMSSALTKACKSNACVYIPNLGGPYLVGQVSTGAATFIYGDGLLSSTLKNMPGSTYLFQTSGNAVTFSGLTLYGNGALTDYGISLLNSDVIIDGCYFNSFLQGVSQVNSANEFQVRNSFINLCTYGVYNSQQGINSKVSNCEIRSCDTAVFVQTGANPTQGFIIEDCLIYSCGNQANNQAVLEINADYTWLRNNVVDGNNYMAARFSSCHWCDIKGGYYAGNNATSQTANIVFQGDCSGFDIDTRTEFAPWFGLQIQASSGTAYSKQGVIKLWSNNNSQHFTGGDILIDSCTGIKIIGTQSMTSTGASIAMISTYQASSADVVDSFLTALP